MARVFAEMVLRLIKTHWCNVRSLILLLWLLAVSYLLEKVHVIVSCLIWRWQKKCRVHVFLSWSSPNIFFVSDWRRPHDCCSYVLKSSWCDSVVGALCKHQSMHWLIFSWGLMNNTRQLCSEKLTRNQLLTQREVDVSPRWPVDGV